MEEPPVLFLPESEGDGEEIADEAGTGEMHPVHGGEGPWLVLSKVAAVAGRWRHPPFLPPPRNR